MGKRTNHYAKEDEKFVKTTIVYIEINPDGNTGTLYYDKDLKNPVYKDELEDLYLDGIEPFILDAMRGRTYLKPLFCTVDGISVINVSGPCMVYATKRPVEVNESNAFFYLEKMTLDGFENLDGETLNGVSNTIVYRNKNRDFEQPITPKTPLVAGETYIVNWDGTGYECVLEGAEGGFYLGLDYYSGDQSKDYPFGIWFAEKYDEAQGITVPTDIKIVFATTPETSHTISIYKMK